MVEGRWREDETFFKPFKLHLQLTYLFVKLLYEFIGVFVVITCK